MGFPKYFLCSASPDTHSYCKMAPFLALEEISFLQPTAELNLQKTLTQ